MRKITPIKDRFWAKVDKNGPVHPTLGTRCWVWTGATLRGYGQFNLGGRGVGTTSAHRIAYELATGMFWSWFSELDVDHRCHNRACVRPAHLRPATRKQNLENRTGAQSNSTTGIRGVSWDKHTRRWVARVTHNGKSVSTYHRTIEQAATAVKARRLKLFTHNDVDRYP